MTILNVPVYSQSLMTYLYHYTFHMGFHIGLYAYVSKTISSMTAKSMSFSSFYSQILTSFLKQQVLGEHFKNEKMNKLFCSFTQIFMHFPQTKFKTQINTYALLRLQFLNHLLISYLYLSFLTLFPNIYNLLELLGKQKTELSSTMC